MDDLRTPRLVPLEEVAKRFDTTEQGIKERLRRGTFPVRPKMKRPLRWSSVELLKFFEDDRRRG